MTNTSLPGYAAVANENTIVIAKDGKITVVLSDAHPNTFTAIQQIIEVQGPFEDIEKFLNAAA